MCRGGSVGHDEGVQTPPHRRAQVFTRTTTHILDSLRDPANADMWKLFDDRYRPVLIAFAKRQGLGPEDAADAAQATLAQFAADYGAGRYERTRGRLSSWIIGIAQHRIVDLQRGIQRRAASSLQTSDEAERESTDDPQAIWDDSVRRVILDGAMQRLRTETKLDARTIQAFEMCAMRSVPAEVAAQECGMSVDEVYVAKNRAIKKLRELVDEMTQEFDAA